MGREIYVDDDIDMKVTCAKLKEVDWSRNASRWRGKIINENGRIMSGEKAISAAADEIRLTLGLL